MTEHVVIVGGGTGGTVLANKLAERLDTELDEDDVRITLVNDDPDHVYKPVWLYVPFGQREPEDGRRRLDELVDDAVDLRVDRVSDVDTDSQRIRFRGYAPSVSYDYLVLATESTLEPEQIPGLVEGGNDYYSESGAIDLRDELLEFTEGELVLSVIGSPHMCPAAPLEFVFMADDWFRERGLREDVDITYTYPIQRVHGNPGIAEWPRPIMEERDIRIETFFNAEEIDPDAETITSMGDRTRLRPPRDDPAPRRDRPDRGGRTRRRRLGRRRQAHARSRGRRRRLRARRHRGHRRSQRRQRRPLSGRRRRPAPRQRDPRALRDGDVRR